MEPATPLVCRDDSMTDTLLSVEIVYDYGNETTP